MYKLISIMLILSTPVVSQNAPIDFDHWKEVLEETRLGQYLKMTRIPGSKLLLILILATTRPPSTVAEFTALQAGMPFAGVEISARIGYWNL